MAVSRVSSARFCLQIPQYSALNKDSQKRSASSLLITVAKFAVSIAILAWLFNSARSNAEFENLFEREKQWGWVGLGFLAALAAHVIGFVRWRVMVRALGLPFTLMDAIRIGFIGVLFNMVAFGVVGGDTLRAFYVTRELKDRTPEAIASVIADRIIGLLTMFSIASAMFLLVDISSISSGNPDDLSVLSHICKFVFVCTVLGFAGIATVICAPWLTKTKWFGALRKLPVVGGVVEKLTDIVIVYRGRPGAVAFSFLLSIGVNICFVVSIYSLAVGLTENHPTLVNHFVIEPIAMVSNAVPLPGGIGGMEWAMSFLYKAFGSTSGVIVAFGFRIALLLVTVIGAGFWFMNKSKVTEIMDTSADKSVVSA